MNGDNAADFDSFVVEYIPKEIKKLRSNKNITTSIYRIQAIDSIMCGYFRIGFINFMIKCTSLLDYTNLFSPKEYEKNDKIFNNFKLNYFYEYILKGSGKYD